MLTEIDREILTCLDGCGVPIEAFYIQTSDPRRLPSLISGRLVSMRRRGLVESYGVKPLLWAVTDDGRKALCAT